MQRIVLVNPNTSESLAALMAEIARENAPACFRIDGLTARFGAPLLTNEAEVDEAARAVRALAPELAQSADAVIVSAFGDPGADELADLARAARGRNRRGQHARGGGERTSLRRRHPHWAFGSTHCLAGRRDRAWSARVGVLAT